MKYNKRLVKKLTALFLVCIMIISLGNGFSMQTAASAPESGVDIDVPSDTSAQSEPAGVQMLSETSQPELTDSTGQTDSTEQAESSEGTESAQTAGTSLESYGGAANDLGTRAENQGEAKNGLFSDGINADVKSGQQTVSTATNDTIKAINVIKQDSTVTKTKLPGVQFEIYGPYDASGTSLPEGAAKIDMRTTNDEGVCAFSGLIPGKWYYLKEVMAANGYALNEDIIPVQTKGVSDLAAITEETVTNDRLGRLEIENTTNMDCEAGKTKPSAGVEFTLYKAVLNSIGEYVEGTNHYSKGDAVGTKSTVMSRDNTKASVTFDDLVPGIYILEEETPEGHASVDEKVITVQPGYNQGTGYPASSDEECVINNTAVKGKVALEVVSSIDKNVHIEAEVRREVA
ncbi:MAG: prealbumin-like fold domain-containing protein [Eubacteriales bacterium]|nr:prealbumin-like fold domain-containing protein [Eubacteriales bacterium]